MTRKVRLREEAGRDLDAAATWYEEQRTGLGHDFLDEVLTTFRSIADRPMAHPSVGRDTRRALVRRFPFAVYFHIEEREIAIIGVLHGSRDPQRWQDRMQC